MRARKAYENSLIINYYLKGASYLEVCEIVWKEHQVKIGPGRVSNVLTKAIESWRLTNRQRVEDYLHIELQKIHRLEMMYHEAWLNSKGETLTTMETKAKRKDADRLGLTEKQEIKKTNAGNPEFLKGVERCIEKRMNILGILKPELAPPPQALVQVNNVNNGEGSKSTTIVRNLIFKTRVTTASPQLIQDTEEN